MLHFRKNQVIDLRKQDLLDETHLVVVRGLYTKQFHPSTSTRRAQMSVADTTVRSTDLLNYNVKTWVNND